MNPAVIKTISLVILIFLGYSLQSKIKTKEQKAGLKTVILSIALPATIFIALLKIEFSWEMAIVPLLALGFNLTMFWLADKMHLVLPSIQPGTPRHRTVKMLIPSLAPGLSAFPFILEYFGEEPLAMAALADVGNKIFGLIILYLIAMRWYYSLHKMENQPVGAKVKDMLLSMIKEPINMVLLVALSMLAFGFSFSSLPEFFQMSATRLSLMMTPLVLLFIGISVKLNWQQFRTIISLLLLRSSIAFSVSALLLLLLPVPNLGIALLIVIFPQSACSFWPFAHMSAVGGMEEISGRTDNPTFDLDFAMNVLACSLPFSTVLILGICTAGEFFSAPLNVFTMTLIFGGLATLPLIMSIFRKKPQMVNQ